MKNKMAVVRKQRRKEEERKERREDGEKRESLAAAPDSKLHGGKTVGSAGPPPPPHPAPDPATLERVSPGIQTLQLALLNCERRTDPKKEAEGRRGHTTGRHQLKRARSLRFSVHIAFYDRLSHKHARGALGSDT